MTDPKEAMEGQRRVQGDRRALEPRGWAQIEKSMSCLPVGPTRREELLIKVRMTALECAARITVDMDPEVTIDTADKFVSWICGSND